MKTVTKRKSTITTNRKNKKKRTQRYKEYEDISSEDDDESQFGKNEDGTSLASTQDIDYSVSYSMIDDNEEVRITNDTAVVSTNNILTFESYSNNIQMQTKQAKQTKKGSNRVSK